MAAPTNPTYEAIRTRTAVRRFANTEVPDRILLELLELANQAPSGFNLQPWHFVLVKNSELRHLLQHIGLDQPQIGDAPATVVFVADPEAWRTTYPRLLNLGLESGRMTPQHVASNKKLSKLMFKTGPLGLFGFFKKMYIPFRRLFQPTPAPMLSYSDRSHYVRAQTMLAAATFMIAAKSAGVDTSPMEGFDEERLKKLLAIPASMTVPVIIAVGYPLEPKSGEPTIRLPLEEKLSIDIFPNRIKLSK